MMNIYAVCAMQVVYELPDMRISSDAFVPFKQYRVIETDRGIGHSWKL